MRLDHYPLKVGDRLFAYEFMSIGPKGKILKLIQFTLVDEELRLYNLGFGDWDESTGDINDKIVTDNGDTQKIMATLVEAVYQFSEEVSGALIYATGSTESRTRLYRIGLNKNLAAVKADFII